LCGKRRQKCENPRNHTSFRKTNLGWKLPGTWTTVYNGNEHNRKFLNILCDIFRWDTNSRAMAKFGKKLAVRKLTSRLALPTKIVVRDSSEPHFAPMGRSKIS